MRKSSDVDAHAPVDRHESEREYLVMTESTVAVIALLVLGWAVVSGALARHDVTGPFVFAVAGYLLGTRTWGR